MLGRCLNPNCGKPFRYLDERRIFRIAQVRAASGTPEIQRSVESFCLCGTCSTRLKLIVENGCVVTSPMDVFALGQKAREMVPVL